MQKRGGKRAAVALVASGALLAPAAIALAAGPTAETLAPDATLISDSYALLSGNINPNGVNVLYRFDWGRTAGYGHTTPVTSAGNGKADVPVDFSLDTLKPTTTYHYRLVVLTDAGQEVDGSDQQFTTTRALGLTLAASKLRLSSKGTAPLKVTAVGPPGERAAGRVTLKVYGHPTILGSVGYSLAVGASKTLTVKLTKAGQKAVAAAGGTLKVVVLAKTRGVAQVSTKTLKLEARA